MWPDPNQGQLENTLLLSSIIFYIHLTIYTFLYRLYPAFVGARLSMVQWCVAILSCRSSAKFLAFKRGWLWISFCTQVLGRRIGIFNGSYAVYWSADHQIDVEGDLRWGHSWSDGKTERGTAHNIQFYSSTYSFHGLHCSHLQRSPPNIQSNSRLRWIRKALTDSVIKHCKRWGFLRSGHASNRGTKLQNVGNCQVSLYKSLVRGCWKRSKHNILCPQVLTLQNFAVSFKLASHKKCCPGGLLHKPLLTSLDEGELIPCLNPDLQAYAYVPPFEPLSWTTCSGGSAQNIRSLWRKTRCLCKLQWRHCFVFTFREIW